VCECESGRTPELTALLDFGETDIDVAISSSLLVFHKLTLQLLDLLLPTVPTPTGPIAVFPSLDPDRNADSPSFCSLLDTQCSTRTQKRISALQHMRQMKPGSPWRTMSTVRLTTDVVRVAQEPTKERKAVRFRAGLVLALYE
jgi:hypothetical protein